MVATKKRPVQTFAEAFRALKSTINYVYIFIYFNLASLFGMYTGEIEKFCLPYNYLLVEYTSASMSASAASIVASIFMGKILDKYRCYKSMQILLSIASLACITGTFFVMEYNAPHWVGMMIIIISAAPISTINVITY